MTGTQFSCPSCAKIIILSSFHGGKTMRCPSCGNAVLVPRVDETVEEHSWRPAAKDAPADFRDL